MKFTPLLSSSKGNLYWLEGDGAPLLIECGAPLKTIRKLTGFRLSQVCGCLLTHSHGDHFVGVADVIRSGVDVYCSQDTADTLCLSGHRVHIIKARVQFAVNSWQVVPFQTEHDCPGSLGFLISDGKDKLLFATDTACIHPTFTGLTHIAIECNYSMSTLSTDLETSVKKRLFSTHFSLENVKKFLVANDLSKVREIHLLHCSEKNGDEEYFQTEIEQLTGKPVFVAKE